MKCFDRIHGLSNPFYRFVFPLLLPLLLLLLSGLSCDSGGGYAYHAPTDGDVVTDGDLPAETDGDEESADLPEGDGADDEASADGDADPDSVEGDTEAEGAEAENPEAWEFEAEDYQRVHGWILLDADPEAVTDSIEEAAKYGVNHIQLSHDLIADIDDVLGDPPKVSVETLNMGIALAHEKGMKVYVWSHEFANNTMSVCYDPDDAFWAERSQVYRDAIAKIPDIDGIILMFGSASPPPWFAFCTCDWCEETYPEAELWEMPPNSEKIRMVTQRLGRTIVDELGKELFIRTFVHEPAELDWHSEGLAGVRGIPFTGMHKGPVQDWQPYNPHHACTGKVGNHPSVVELDVAGEYYGQSILPFCAPGYYRYRLDHMWKNKGIGAVIRVQRGGNHALGTPNQVNMLAIKQLTEDPDRSLELIWDDFLEDFYGLAAEDAGQSKLKQILKNTFPIRLKSHYVLGVWALSKGSGFPTGLSLDQFEDRGEMPKWDADWQEIWDKLDRPDKQTVINIWQESSEACELADQDLADMADLADTLDPDRYADLLKRLKHQAYAADAWRAMKLVIWSKRAMGLHPEDTDLAPWIAWGRDQLPSIREAMIADGLGSIGIASPGEIDAFLGNTTDIIPNETVPAEPPEALFSPIRISNLSSSTAQLAFTPRRTAKVILDWGLEIPDYGQEVDLGELEAGKKLRIQGNGLPAGRRVAARLRATVDGKEYLGGDFWIFMPE